MKIKKNWMTLLAVLFMAAWGTGCKNENVGKIGVCPVVVSTSPADGSVGIGLDKIITITFNEAINPSTITPQAFSLAGPDGVGARVSTVSGTLAYDASTFTVSYTPMAKLKSNTIYKATVSTAI